MKKTSKTKKATKKSTSPKKKITKKAMKASAKSMAKGQSKAKTKAKSLVKPAKKNASSGARKSKGLTVTELFAMKQAREQEAANPSVTGIPPQELHDNVNLNLQTKNKMTPKAARGPGPGNRHH